MNDYDKSLAFVRNAIASLPDELARTLEVELPRCTAAPKTVVTTGIGASEAPARLLAAQLLAAGVAASFRPLSDFCQPRQAELLVLFSQGLSPNARLALENIEGFARRWLVTSIDTRVASPAKRELLAQFVTRGFVPIVIPPRVEQGTLVRLVGPTVASLAALRLASLLLDDGVLAGRIREAPAAYRAAGSQRPLSDAALAIVTIGVPTEQAHAQRWKLLEALLQGDPPVWDVLQFAHGPLQTFHDQPLTLLVLERGRGSPLLARLQATLDPALQRVIHLSSERADELAMFEHAAGVDALLLATLEARPRDLFDWPARNGDGPLYGVERSSS